MTPDEDPFIAALAADPADETTRLVYADWLEERGDDARAAYLRAELAHFRMSAEDRRNDECSDTSGVDPIWAAMVSRTGVLVPGLTFSDTGPKVTRADLRAIEDHWGRPLPADYAAFLLLHNGGIPSKPYLWSYLDDDDFFDAVRFFSTRDTHTDGRPVLLTNPGELLADSHDGEVLAAFAGMLPVGTLTYDDERETILALILDDFPPLCDRLIEIEHSDSNGLSIAEDVHAKESFSDLLHSLDRGP